ncbi:hypothetical protein [Cupriavidus taiwanensis]|uniref:hypothetical protein n=1 Tax=Cupriavidus taiwanensis TaxID=164546 RepID=UPI0011C039FF|nr:hypothetical protein [Cupriavidus taiwanensis]
MNALTKFWKDYREVGDELGNVSAYPDAATVADLSLRRSSRALNVIDTISPKNGVGWCGAPGQRSESPSSAYTRLLIKSRA